ncbi:hypothetical protein [Pseudonocardia zijingensis]|uniref:hypothetical protein n=1 Tax=Pseudonocardia zijingensis TaxID=153376 RepID=UPI0031DD8414
MVTAAMIVAARWVTRLKVGSIAQLEAAITGLVGGPEARTTAAEVMSALEGRGILNLGDLVVHTADELRALGLTAAQVVLVERGLAELGHTLRGPPPAARSSAARGVAGWARAHQGLLVGAHQGVGMTAAMVATYATFSIAQTYGVPAASTLLLAFAGWGVGGASLLLVNALFGRRLGPAAGLAAGVVSSVALAAVAVAPPVFAVLVVLYGLSGVLISASAIFQAGMARHPLPKEANDARTTGSQTWAAIARAWLPLAVAGAVAAFGWRGATVALAAAFAGLTAMTWLALRGGEQPPAATGSAWREAVGSVTAATRRAFSSPRALVRFLVAAPLLGFLLGFPIGWMLGALSSLLKVHLPWLAPEHVVWASALVTFVHRYAAAWANKRWAKAAATRRWMNTPVATTATMFAVPPLVGVLLIWPHAAPLVVMLVAVSVAFQLPMAPAMARTRGVGGVSRFFVGTQLGAAAGVGLAQVAVQTLAPGGLTAATAGPVELALGVGYTVVAVAAVAVAHLVTRLKGGSLSELEARLDPAARAGIMTALERGGILNLGDLTAHTRDELRDLGLTEEQVVHVERGLAELGHTLRGPPSGPGGGAGAWAELRAKVLEARTALVRFAVGVAKRPAAGWRERSGRGHRALFLVSAAVAMGMTALGAYAVTVWSEALHLPPGRLLTLALVGNLAGLAVQLLLNSRWPKLPVRWQMVGATLISATAYVLFTLGAGGLHAGAVLAGFAASGWTVISTAAYTWSDAHTAQRTALGQRVRLAGSANAVVLLGSAVMTWLLLSVQGAVAPAQPDVAAWFSATFAVLSAAGLWATAPSRVRAGGPVEGSTAGTLSSLRGFTFWLSLTFGLTVAPTILFDGNWREVVGSSSPLLLTLLSLGLVSGGVLGTIAGKRIEHKPGAFILVTAGSLVAGVLAAFAGAQVAGGQFQTHGIAVAAFAAEAGATGMILGIFELVRKRVPAAKQARVITTATLTKFVFGIAASQLGAPVWNAAQWSGITWMMAPLGVAALVSAAVLVRRYGGDPEPGSGHAEGRDHGPSALRTAVSRARDGLARLLPRVPALAVRVVHHPGAAWFVALAVIVGAISQSWEMPAAAAAAAAVPPIRNHRGGWPHDDPDIARLLRDLENLDEVLATASPDYVAELAVFADRWAAAAQRGSDRRLLDVKVSLARLRRIPTSPVHRQSQARSSGYTWLDLLDDLGADRAPTLLALVRAQLTRADPVDHDTLAMGLAVLRASGVTETRAHGAQRRHLLRREAIALRFDPALRRVLGSVPLRIDRPIGPVVAAFRRFGLVPAPVFTVRDLLHLVGGGPRSTAEVAAGFPGPEPTLRLWLTRLVDWGLLVADRRRPMRYALSDRAVTWLRDARTASDTADGSRASALVTFANLLDTLSPRDQSEVGTLAGVIARLHRLDTPVTTHELLALLATGVTVGRLRATTGLPADVLLARIGQLQGLGLVLEEPSGRPSTYRVSPLGVALLRAVEDPDRARPAVADATDVEIAEYRGLVVNLGLVLKTTTDLAAAGMDTAIRYLLTRARLLPPTSGAVLNGRWGEGRQDRWEQLLPTLERLGFTHEPGGTGPRAPPAILEIPLDETVYDLLRDAGLADLPGRLLGYYWAGRDAVVVFAPTLFRLRRAGLLERLLAHEDFFHRQGRAAERNEDGLTHAEDEAEIIRLLADASQRASAIAFDEAGLRVALSEVHVELVRAALVERTAAGAVGRRTDELALRAAGAVDPQSGESTLVLVDQLSERLAEMLAAAGMDQVTVVQVRFEGLTVVSDRALFLERILELPEPVRQGLWAEDPLVELDDRLVELVRSLPAAIMWSLHVRRLIAVAVAGPESASAAWELGRVDAALGRLVAGVATLAAARDGVARPEAWRVRVDDRAIRALDEAEARHSELRAAVTNPAVLHRVGLRAFDLIDRDGARRTLTNLAGELSAPIELVRAAVAGHPELSIDTGDVVGVAGRSGEPQPAPRLPAGLGLELPPALAPHGALTARAGSWLVGSNRPLRPLERAGWLRALVGQAWAASPGADAVIGRTEVHRVAVSVPDGLRLLGPDAADAAELVLVVHRIHGGRTRLVNAFPAGPAGQVPRTPRLVDSVPAIRDGRTLLGTGWAIAPHLVLAPLRLFGDRDLSEITVDGVTPETVIALAPESFGVAQPLVEWARRVGRTLFGADLGTADVAVLYVPGLHAVPLAVSPDIVATGRTLLVAGRDAAGVLRLTLAPVVATGLATITLAAPLDTAAPGSPVLAPGGEVVGMVVEVDQVSGLATALAGPLLVAAGAGGRTAARAEGATPDLLLDHVSVRLELAGSVLGEGRAREARRHLRRVELALDDVAGELGPRRFSHLPDAEFHAVFERLVALGREWWLLLNAARGPPADTAASDIALQRAAALFAGEVGGPLAGAEATLLADAALDLGRPAAWRVQVHHAVDQAGVAALRRAFAPPPADHRPSRADVERAHHSLRVLVDQLPAELGDPLAGLLARWTVPGEPPAGLLAYLEGELPEPADGPAAHAVAAVRHHLRQAQPGPGRTGGFGIASALAVTGFGTAVWWALVDVLGRSATAEAAPRHEAAPTGAEDHSVLKALVVLGVAYAGYRLVRAGARWVGRTLRAAGEAALAWGGRQLTRARWVLLGTGIGWVAAATGYGLVAAGAGILLAVVPALVTLVAALWPRMPGSAVLPGIVKAWYELRPPWQVGAGLLMGVGLWVFAGDAGGAAAAAVAVPGWGRSDPVRRDGVVIAESDQGLVLVTDPAAVARVLDEVRELWRRERMEPGDRDRFSPSGLWKAAGLWPFVTDAIDVRGLRVHYVLDVARGAVIVPRAVADAGQDERTTLALEREILLGLYGGAPETGRRPVDRDVEAGPARPASPDPRLPALAYLGTLGDSFGRPAVVHVAAGRDRLVVHRRGLDLDRSLDTAAAYRVLGVPAVATWPAVVAEDVRDGSGAVVLRAGERVEVGYHRDGGPVDLDDPRRLAQVARLHAAAEVIGDVDVRGVKEVNLVADAAGNIGLVDFNAGLTLDSESAEAHLQLVIDGALFDTRAAQAVFGVLTEADLLAGYRHVVERRAELLAVIRDPARRLVAAARVDLMSRIVAAGRLPDRVRAQLRDAAPVAARAHPGERLPDQAYRLGFGPAETRLLTSALTHMRREAVGRRADGGVFVFAADRLAAEVREHVPAAEAADVVERLVAFAWHDADGLVVAISEERYAELDRLGALAVVLDGARSRVPDSRPPGAI